MSYLLKRSRNKVAVRELAAGLTFFTIQVLTKQIACINAKRDLHLCLHFDLHKHSIVWHFKGCVRNACKAELCKAKLVW